jgi:penicillin-binding protein 2
VNERSLRRLFVLRALVVALVLTLLGRLWFLQVVSGSTYAVAATSNTTRVVVDNATRGWILDDEGVPLVDNVSAYVVSVDRTVLAKQKDDGKRELALLAPLVSTGGKRLTAVDLADKIRLCDYVKIKPPNCWKGSPYQPVPVAEFASASTDPRQATAIAVITGHAVDFPGVSVELKAVRDYPASDNGVPGTDSKLAAQALGYTGPITQDAIDKAKAKGDALYAGLPSDANIGQDGLEYYYDRMLRGQNGNRTVQVNAQGDVEGTVSTTAPRNGDHLVLNLDRKVQLGAEQALHNALTTYAARAMSTDPKGNAKPTTGAAVVMTSDGRVVALANAPSYDPSVFLNGISEHDFQAFKAQGNDSPLLDRAATQDLSPGSSWKVVSATAALKYGLTSPGGTQPCSPSLPVGSGPTAQNFHNFDGESAGFITIAQALEISCDVIFDKFAYDEWLKDGGLRANGHAREIFTNTAKAYGFGSPTGIDLPAESAGLVRDRASARQFWLDTKASSCRSYKHEQGLAAQYDEENCKDGYLYNGGLATQFGIGQGPYLGVTVLQMARAYAAIANGGTLYTPTLAKAFVRPDGTVDKTIKPAVDGHLPVGGDVLAAVREGLEQVTHGDKGTAVSVFGGKVFPVDVAGKTGTAETQPLDKNGNPLPATETSWFASYAPANPAPGQTQYVVVVAVPKSNQGALVAAPAVRDIYDAIFGVKDGKLVPHTGAFNGSDHRPQLLPCFQADGRITKPQRGCSTSETSAPQPPTTPQPSPVLESPSAVGSGTALGSVLDPPGVEPDRRGSAAARRAS